MSVIQLWLKIIHAKSPQQSNAVALAFDIAVTEALGLEVPRSDGECGPRRLDNDQRPSEKNALNRCNFKSVIYGTRHELFLSFSDMAHPLTSGVSDSCPPKFQTAACHASDFVFFLTDSMHCG
jgi:hypothetical protein